MKVGVEGFYFEAAHYTRIGGCDTLHGHTFRVDVAVEGPVDPRTGIVVDFKELSRIVEEVISEWDHSLIIPEADEGKVQLEGPFKLKVKVVKGVDATAEEIAKQIAFEIYAKLKGSYVVEVKLYEGRKFYVVAHVP